MICNVGGRFRAYRALHPHSLAGIATKDYQGLTEKMPAVSVKPLTAYSSRKRKMTEDALGGS